MSVRIALTRSLALLTLVSLAACSSDSLTGPRRAAPTTPSATMCPGGYSLAEGKC